MGADAIVSAMGRRVKWCTGAAVAAALASTRLAVAEQAPPLETDPVAARAPIGSRLEVERGVGTEKCPDAAAVFRALARLFPERTFRESADGASVTASARVVIRALPSGFEAVLSMRLPHPGERVILEKDQSCAGLADALALAFMLLVEPPAGKAHSASSDDFAAPVPASTPVKPVPALRPQTNASRRASADTLAPRAVPSFKGKVATAGLAGFGLLTNPAAGLAIGVELFHASGWGAALGGVRLWSPAVDAEGGSVRLSVWAVLGGPCYERALGGVSSLDVCVRFGAGSQYAQVGGFAPSHSGSFPWVIVVPTLGYRLAAARALTGLLRVGPVAQLRPQSFSAESGAGSGQTVQIARAPNVGVMAELGLLIGGAEL